MNLTDQQKQLLRILVANHHASGGKEFYFTQSMTASGVSYPGNRPGSVACDDIDLDALRRERLIELILVSRGVARGRPTQLGIDTVAAEQSNPDCPRCAENVIPAQGVDSSELKSVQLPDLQGRYPADAKSEAMREVECARSQWEYMVAADRKLATCTLMETIDLEQERERRLANTISHLELAISVLFDGLAQAYWNSVRPDVERFFLIVPAIAMDVEESIVFPELKSMVRDTISDRQVQWKERVAQLGIITNSAQWSQFRTTFNDLARRENHLFGQVTDDHLLGACGVYENARQEVGDWSLRGSNELLREEFTLHGIRAGIALGVPGRIQPLDFWFHRLFGYLLDNEKTEYLFASTKERGGIIRRLLEASALFCTFLERVATQNDHLQRADDADEIRAALKPLTMPQSSTRDGRAPQNRAVVVDEFLRRCNEEVTSGVKVIKKHIWLAVGHTNQRQFQYWQQCNDKATDADNTNFRRILSMTPKDFIALLRKQRHLPAEP